MKPIIYLNNFRGFKKTYLQLERVNFFVGENSTGKTSVLKLIKIFSNSEFWFKNDSDHFRKEFGYYSEISDDTFFEVGLFSAEVKKFVVLRFINNQGFAELVEVNQIDPFINIHISLTKRGTEYKFEKKGYDNYFQKDYLSSFKKWVDNKGLNNAPLNVEKTDRSLKNFHIPLILRIEMIITRHLKDKERAQMLRVPFLVEPLAWLAPIRTEPKRTYDDYELSFSPEGTHVPYLLKKQLTDKRNSKQSKKFETILNRFGEDSGMFEKITVTQYSKSNLSPFDINIVLNGKALKIINVGYGVSQILPLIVETVIRSNNSWFALQQPEIHLHPRGQAAFGDLLYKSALNDNKGFIVETHSDYTIDRYRLKVSKTSDSKQQDNIASQVVFFHRTTDGNHLDLICINPDGSYSEDQPKEFTEFFLKEEMALLQM